MTKDEAKGYCGYIIAKLGVRSDDDRVHVIGEIGKILNKRYPSTNTNLDNEYDQIRVKEVSDILEYVLLNTFPHLVKMRNYKYLVTKGFKDLKSPGLYYKKDGWMNRKSWMYDCDEMIEKGMSYDEILDAMKESIKNKEVTLKALDRYLENKGVVVNE